MTTTVEVSFPWGQYHGTAWGRHVNEGEVDWPPAPWRILRALYCTWRERAADIPAETVESLLTALADPPSYRLPPHSASSTRHYYPDTAHSTDRVIDAFMSLERDAKLLIQWEATLSAPQCDSLASILTLLPYLGRSESLCAARLLSIDPDPSDGQWVGPVDGSHPDSINLLAPLLPLHFESLIETTDRMRGNGRLRPSQSRWVPYDRPSEASTQPPFLRRHKRKRPTAVRYAISSAALPSVHLVAVIGQSMRSAAMSKSEATSETDVPPLLAGKDARGERLKDHRHAHYLPFDEDGDGLLDHILVWAPGMEGDGLDERSLKALLDINHVAGRWSRAGVRSLRVAVEAVGAVTDAAPFLTGPSRFWRSHTPFAPPRHWKGDADAYVRTKVERASAERGHPPPAVSIERHRDWLSFRRHRLGERLEDARRAVGLELDFGTPITGPVCLGALSHFGLGLFIPSKA